MVILAIIGYVSVAVFTFFMFFSEEKEKHFVTFIIWIFLCPIPFFCFHNFLGIWDKLPFSKGATKRNQRIVYTVLGVMSILFGLIIIGVTNLS